MELSVVVANQRDIEYATCYTIDRYEFLPVVCSK